MVRKYGENQFTYNNGVLELAEKTKRLNQDLEIVR
jgi:hypothetical protein